MKNLGLILVVVAACCCSGEWQAVAGSSSALQTDAAGWVDIQPDGNLSGWIRLPIPSTNSPGRQQWHVDAPGLLVCDGDGGHEMLRFRQEFTNGIFHVEFRYPPLTVSTNVKYNSGVFVRTSADGAIWHQAQLTMDGGYLFGNSPVAGVNQRFKTSAAERRMKPAGEWNIMEVGAQGNVLRVWLNGGETCVYDQCAVPKGFIALEAEGYRIEFRNLKYKRLD